MTKKLTAQELYQKACERFSTYPVGQRHPPLLGVAIAAYNAGFRDENALAAELKAMWSKHGQGSVDENDCNNTAKTAIKMAEEQGGYIEPKSTVSKEEKAAQKQQAKLVEAHRKRWAEWVADIMKQPLIVDHADEVESTDDQEQRMKDTIQKLVPNLAKDEFIFCGGVNWDKQATAYVTIGYDLDAPQEQCFWSPNRLDARERTKDHCKAISYMLLEMDEVLEEPKETKGTEAYYDALCGQQAKLWNVLRKKLPVACLTYSGGKSIHALIPVAGTAQELEALRTRLNKAYSELHMDTANIDAVRKTRTPYGLRKYYVSDDDTIVDGTKVDFWRWQMRSKSVNVKTEARTKLAEAGITDASECVWRLQDCMLLDPSAKALTLAEYADALEKIVAEFIPVGSDEVEQAVIDGEAPLLTTGNVEKFLEHKQWKLWWDSTMLKPHLTGADFDETDLEVIENMISDGWMETYNVKATSHQKLSACLKTIYKENQTNSALEWFRSLPWDGVDRLPAIYSILGVTSEIEKTMIRKWLIQCVALQENGDELHLSPCGILTFRGRQGAGKTTFLTELFPRNKYEWVVSGASLNIENKDDLKNLIKGVIVELGEVDSTLKRDQTRLKAVITNVKQSIRLPYDRSETEVFSHVSLCASVNEEVFLKDSTGNRRWWVIEPKSKIDLDRMAVIDREQLWGQVWRMWDASDKRKWWETYGLTDTERAELENRNAEFREDSGYESAILETFDFDDPDRSNAMSATEVDLAILNRAVDDEDKMIQHVQPKDQTNIGRGLAALGVKKARKSYGVIYYMPPKRTNLAATIATDAMISNANDPLFGSVAALPSAKMADQPLPEEEKKAAEAIVTENRRNEVDL